MEFLSGIHKIQKEEEIDIITGMIVSAEYLQRIRPIINLEYFDLPYARIVANWCIEYFDRYSISPKSDIKSIFEHKKRDIEENKIELIQTFLDRISERYSQKENFNVEYVLDKTILYFKNKKLDILVEKIKGAILDNDFDGAESEIANYKRIEKHITGGLDVLNDKSAVARTIRGEGDNDVLMRMPGQFGKLLGAFNRSDFIAVVGPAKRSKSMWLAEMAIMALWNKLNVVFFSLEMAEKRMLQRIYQRITGEINLTNNGDGLDREIKIPFFGSNWEWTGEINHRITKKKGLSVKHVIRKIDSFRDMITNKNFHLICRPANSMTVGDIETCLNNIEYYDKVIPDVIIVDYADIVRPDRKIEKRHQIDEIWTGLRSMAQNRSCLVLTGSHSSKATFERDIRQNDLSEDARKLNHVTMAFGLNQDADEKRDGVMRINVLANRFEHFNTADEVVVLQCLDICRPYIDSRKKNKDNKEKS